MSSTVNWAFNLSVLQGPSVSLSKSIMVDAYDSINVPIANDAADHAVQITSLTSSDGATFLLINSNQWDESAKSSSATFTYKVTVGSTTTPSSGAYTLDGPQFLTSGTLVGLLIPVPSGTTNPTPVYLTFNNKTSAPANISILVGRKAS
jgi:hypothetical protein